jgi:hypothetical protein
MNVKGTETIRSGRGSGVDTDYLGIKRLQIHPNKILVVAPTQGVVIIEALHTIYCWQRLPEEPWALFARVSHLAHTEAANNNRRHIGCSLHVGPGDWCSVVVEHGQYSAVSTIFHRIGVGLARGQRSVGPSLPAALRQFTEIAFNPSIKP